MLLTIPLLWLYHVEFGSGQNNESFSFFKLLVQAGMVVSILLYMHWDREAVALENAEKAEAHA